MAEGPSVLFAPWAKLNPYQDLLARHLEEQGVVVENLHGDGDGLLGSLTSRDRVLPEQLPDILHLHWVHPYIRPDRVLEPFVLGPRLLRRVLDLQAAGVKVVWTVHNLRSHESFIPWLEKRHLRRLARIVDAMFVHCGTAGDLAEKAYGEGLRDRLFVVPHANYIGRYPDGMEGRAARRRLGFDEEDRVLLFFGQLRRYKGLMDLVRAFGPVEDPNARLLVVGKPKDGMEAELLRLKGDDGRIVVRPEYVPDEKVQLFMAASDAVVLPFRNILTSGSAILSMSFCKPVVAPLIGCIPDLLERQKDLLYDPRDREGLARALGRVVSCPRERLQETGRRNQEAIKGFTWKRMAAETAAVYNGVMGR